MTTKHLNTVATRIQTRLSRKGLKVALGEIKDYLIANAGNIENITDVEVNTTTDYFMSNATQLTVISDVVEPTTTNEAASELETLTNNNSEELETTPETSICSVMETLPQSSQLTTTTKNELVSSTAVNLGIELSTQDIENIADNFDAGSDDFTQTLKQVKGAIIAYVQHKIASNNQKITDTINEISQVASDGFEENSQTLTNGLKQLNQQLVQQSTDFKSRLTGTLSRFKLPEAS